MKIDLHYMKELNGGSMSLIGQSPKKTSFAQ